MDILGFITVLILIFFTLMVSFLLMFHTYLAVKNITTWEILSWSKISYLKEFNKDQGSPFSLGFRGNIYHYCFEAYSNKYKEWNLFNILLFCNPQYI